MVGIALVYVMQIALARLYGPELMGTFLIATNLSLLIGMVLTMGMDNGMLRFAASLKEQGRQEVVGCLLRRAGLVILAIATPLAAGIYWGSGILAKYFNAPSLPLMLPFVALAVLLLPLTFLLAETLRGLGAVVWATAIQFPIQQGALLLLIVAFFYLTPAGNGRGQALSWPFCSVRF